MSARSKKRQWLFMTFLLFAICFLSSPVAHAQLFEKTDTNSEIERGREGARAIEAQIPPSKNRAMQERVRRIGAALVAALPEKAYPYEFKVLASPEFNAICLPGGFMYVFEGLLTRLPDDDAVAYVMGHEITHASHRHWASETRKTSRDWALGVLFDIATRSNVGTETAARLSYAYSREYEADADRTGLELMWTAGYDPDKALAAPRMMAELEAASGRRIPPYMRSHPHPKDRLRDLEALSGRLKARPRPSRKGDVASETIPTVDAITMLAGSVPNVASGDNTFYPLVVGANWTYDVAGGVGGSSRYTVRIAGKMANPDQDGAANVTVFRAVTVLGRGVEVPFQILATPKEVWRRNRPTAKDSLWYMEHFVELEADQTADRSGTSYQRLPSETVSTPCGVFESALKVRRKSQKYTMDLWYARGVGVVKTYCVETGVTEVLAAYTIPAASK